MVNSTPCPLCENGVGHAMDDEHAMRVEELLRLVKELSEVPLLSETPGIAKGVECSEMDELICEARQSIAKAERKE